MSSSQKGSIYDGCSRPIATATSTIENLQTQYKLKEGNPPGHQIVPVCSDPDHVNFLFDQTD